MSSASQKDGLAAYQSNFSNLGRTIQLVVRWNTVWVARGSRQISHHSNGEEDEGSETKQPEWGNKKNLGHEGEAKYLTTKTASVKHVTTAGLTTPTAPIHRLQIARQFGPFIMLESRGKFWIDSTTPVKMKLHIILHGVNYSWHHSGRKNFSFCFLCIFLYATIYNRSGESFHIMKQLLFNYKFIRFINLLK